MLHPRVLSTRQSNPLRCHAATCISHTSRCRRLVARARVAKQQLDAPSIPETSRPLIAGVLLDIDGASASTSMRVGTFTLLAANVTTLADPACL